MTDTTELKTEPAENNDPLKTGDIVAALIKAGYITAEQSRYAHRIRSKLATPKTVLEVLKELKQITDGQIREAIQNHRVEMRIGNLLVELGQLSESALKAAFSIKADEKSNRKIGEILVDHNFIDERKLIEVLSMQMGFPYIDPQFAKIETELYRKVPPKWYDDHRLIPIRREGDKILIAFADPLDKHELDSARNFSAKTFSRPSRSKAPFLRH